MTELERRFMDELWIDSCTKDRAWFRTGKTGLRHQRPELPSVDILREEEWSPLFEKLMRNRLLQGAYRYGRLRETGGDLRRVESAVKRLVKYLETGNAELLVDAANLCMCEFEVPGHPRHHFNTVDDGDHHWK